MENEIRITHILTEEEIAVVLLGLHLLPDALAGELHEAFSYATEIVLR